MSFVLHGWGLAVPEAAIDQAVASGWASQISGLSEPEARRLSALYRRTGIRRRHAVALGTGDDPSHVAAIMRSGTAQRMDAYDEAVRPLARLACGRALDDSGVDPSAITHLVTASCTGFSAPGFDLDLIEHLGLSPETRRTHVGFMGCHGAMNALRVASAFAGSDPEARVLVCAAELCSLHFRLANSSEEAVANSLFADGAAAVVGSAGEATGRWRIAAEGSALIPETRDAMSWRIGDQGFAMTLSPRVSGLIAEDLRPWLASWLGRNGLAIGEVGSWAVHPGGPRVLDAVQASLGLEPDTLADSRAVLADRGNMSSPTILFILDRLRRRDAPRPCVALAFGPGLAIEAMILR